MEERFADRIKRNIDTYILSHGTAPSLERLGQLSQAGPFQVEEALTQLSLERKIVLHPAMMQLWVSYPFALVPTRYWVRAGQKQWWANCAWCALGIAALAKSDTAIFFKKKGQHEVDVLNIQQGNVVQATSQVHIPQTFMEADEKSCRHIQLFTGSEEIDDWCQKQNEPKGKVLPATEVWEMAQWWFAGTLDKGSPVKGMVEESLLLAHAGLG